MVTDDLIVINDDIRRLKLIIITGMLWKVTPQLKGIPTLFGFMVILTNKINKSSPMVNCQKSWRFFN